MKKIILCLSILSVSTFVFAQNGLEGIIVEKYYVSDVADSIATDDISANPGALPVGSVTYRIYADLLPGYKFQVAYGIDNPLHELRISTTTLFFNNEDRGATTPNGISKTNSSHNTVMLDSWLSVGAACSGNYGILKTLDDGVATIINTDGVLQNNDLSAGIPLTTQDGLIATTGTPEPVTTIGITNEIIVFDSQNDGTNGPVFSTINGSWACLNGTYGPDPVENKVLIAQITTNGTLCFELNIQIGTPTGGVENYVAQNPIGNEIQIPSLTYCSTLGINESESENSSFKILSNPVKDKCTLEITTPKASNKNSYTIFDMAGNVLLYKNIGRITEKHSESLNLSSLSNGTYLVEVNINGTSSAKKIIKE